MKVIHTARETQTKVLAFKRAGKKVGFVPTMGFLHEGHLSLVDLMRTISDVVLVSIYVNPTQFGAGEDFNKYPRDLQRDLDLCMAHGVDLVFVPNNLEIYPDDSSTYVVEEEVGNGMCGNSRPTHFKGVTTVCAKLFNICQPTFVALGQKDAQQVVVLKRMVRDLHFPIEIVVGPIIREKDGLAMSSRNAYLDAKQRKEALLIYQSLQTARKLVEKNGTNHVERVKAEALQVLTGGSHLRVNYIEIVNRETMSPESEIVRGRSLLAVAVWIDQVRLIDNFCF